MKDISLACANTYLAYWKHVKEFNDHFVKGYGLFQ